MTSRKHLHSKPQVCSWTGLGALLCLLLASCTDSDLYQWKTTPYQANKLAVSGTVCTDDLGQADFPIKILFMIDMSQALKASVNDPYGRRGQAIEDMVNLWGKNPNFSFGINIFGSKAKNLLTDATGQQTIGFTRDSSKLLTAAQLVKSGGAFSDISTCRSGRCRDYRAALSLANSIISGDLLASDPGVAARTTYVMVMFAGGPPVPPLGRCACRDLDDEKVDGKACKVDSDCDADKCAGGKCMNKWEGCGFKECDNCKVTCPTTIAHCAPQAAPCSTCKGTQCFPVCSPACDSDEYCDANYICQDGSPTALPTVQAVSSVPPNISDTFAFYAPPPTSPGACKSLTCVYTGPGSGNASSCEEKLIVLDVREIKDFAIKNGVGQLQLHTMYLPDKATRKVTDPFYPPGPGSCAGNVAANKARTVRLLSQMAYAGNGGFQEFTGASAIQPGFRKIGQDIYTSQDALVFKELVVSNINVLPDENGIQPDTDADGLVDPVEKKIGTCISDRDTDGDGLGDSIEVKLASNPLKADKPVECVDLTKAQEIDDDPCNKGTSKTWTVYSTDQDGDGMNACEERLLGTDDSLYDTDADGIPDWIEFVSGTNYLANDPLKDSDLDGIVNREEVRGHTNPRSNDSHQQLDLAYRYEEVDEGLKEVYSFSQPTLITGVKIKNVSASTSAGPGYLKYLPAAGKKGATLAWRDYGDMDIGGDYGPAVDITKPDKDGYKLTSCRKKSGGGCTKDSVKKFITVLVDGPTSYLKKNLIERVTISSAKRNCLRFTVRNVTLMETGMDRYLKSTGNNTVNIYFAEAPASAKSGYGMFRIGSIRLRYTKGPPEDRTPKSPEITFTDEDFILDIDN